MTNNPFLGMFFDPFENDANDLADETTKPGTAINTPTPAPLPPGSPIMPKTQVYKFVTKNFLFSNTMQGDMIDVHNLMQKYHFIAGQECNDENFATFIRNGKHPTWAVQQNPRGWEQSGGLNAWDKRLGIVTNRGTELLVNPIKSRINKRFIKWVDWSPVRTSKTIRILSLHLPPKDEWKWSIPAARNIIEFGKRSPYPLMIGADWNVEGVDNFGIAKALNMSVHKFGIDGWLVSKSINVVGTRTIEPKGHSDHHGVGISVTI